jgi:hypothetical protein
MKASKKLLKGSIPILAIAVILVAFNVKAHNSNENSVESILGEFCFTFEFYADTWHWLVEDMGSGVLQWTGYDSIYPSSSLNGGGMVRDGHLYGTMVITDPSNGYRAIHAIDIDLATMTGVTDFTWLTYDNCIVLKYLDEPILNVPCVAIADKKGFPTSQGYSE